MAHYSRQDYKLVADIISGAMSIFPGIRNNTVLVHLAAAFAKKFAEDNPRFDMERFDAACTVPRHFPLPTSKNKE